MLNIRIGQDEQTPIDRKIFGNFIEHIENCILGGIFDKDHPLSDENGIRTDVLEACRELAPPILRFPGGTVIGIYHWEDHVGPVSERKRMQNLIWGDRLCHEFGTAEFVSYCRAIGAEPMLCVNMPTGSAEEAAHWVEYCNGTGDTYYANLRRSHGYEEPFGVKYWCIGNESHAEPDLGWQHDVNIYVREAWEFCKYMKLTDPEIKLVLVGQKEAWNRAVLDSMYGVCDYLSVHFYASTNDYDRITRFENGTLRETEALLREYNAREIVHSHWYRFPPRSAPIRIALDEWNIWSSGAREFGRYGLQRRYTWRDALFTARFLLMMIRHAETVGIANLAQMVNVIAPIVSDARGTFRQTTFYPLKLFTERCGNTRLAVSTDADAPIDLCATRNADGSDTVLLVNHTEEPITLRFARPVTEMTVLSCADPDAVNGHARNAVTETTLTPNDPTATLPPYSVAAIDLGA